MSYKSFLNKYLNDNSDCAGYVNFEFDKFYGNDVFNKNFDVDFLADWFQNLYLNSLDDERLFAKKSEWDQIIFDYYEISAFKSHFKKYFKTMYQFKKTKDILSDRFTFRSKDIKGKLHTFYFCASKKDYDKYGVDYLEELQAFLNEEIFKQVNLINEK